jgi:phosphatidylserine/phosphatidylglycerophosphate/cardiolipin synthase-like enzyme
MRPWPILCLRLLLALVALSGIGPGRAQARDASPGFELVYTAPTETTLGRQGLRSPVEVWPELFDQASATIDIAEFYITHKPGEPLGPVLERLRRAGARGVKIRVLLDGWMARQSAAGMAALREIPNLTLRVIDWGKVNGSGILHAKYMVIDRSVGYVGSHNFDWRSLKHIQELGLRISEPAIVTPMQAIFERDWQAQAEVAAGRAPARRADRQVPGEADMGRRAYLVASPFAYNPDGVFDSERELVRLIEGAREEVRAQVMDYAPLSFRGGYYPIIDNALRAAAARRVKIKLIVSNWNADPPGIDHLKSLAVLPAVAVRMVTIPQAKEGFIPYARVIHAKYMIVDGKLLWLGKSNWTGGYLDNSRNLEVVLRDEGLAAEATAIHEQVWGSPYAEALDIARRYPVVRRR